MTNHEAIQFLDNMKHEEAGRAIGKDGFYAELIGYHVQALRMAIKALEQEPCEDCISRKEALKMLDWGWKKGIYPSNKIAALPSVTPAEKAGHWINVNEGKWNTIPTYKCSECGANADLRDWSGESPYCPWCGCKMQEGKE